MTALIRQHNADQDSQDSQRVLRIPSDSEEDLPAEAEPGLELENELEILRARKAKAAKGKTTLQRREEQKRKIFQTIQEQRQQMAKLRHREAKPKLLEG